MNSSTSESFDPQGGARNLLLDCIGVKAGERVLIVREDPALGYYDAQAPACVAREAEALGCRTEVYLNRSLLDGPEDLPKGLATAVAEADHTIFFDRMGDQLRFLNLSGGGSKTMCYALDIDLLGSSFCTAPHGLMLAVLDELERVLERAGHWRITCPHGTDIAGPLSRPPKADREGFTLKLFPVVIFDPIPCQGTSGQVAFSHWLMPTGTHRYEPDVLLLDQPVTALVENGRIAGFEGEPGLVARVRAHYRHVAGLFGIDPHFVHSWHTGIHPRTHYRAPAREDIERWGGMAFASPRYTHFHTCGETVPGEIAWSLFDATIRIDDEILWDQGRFVFLDRPEARALLDAHSGSEGAFEPRYDIGIEAA